MNHFNPSFFETEPGQFHYSILDKLDHHGRKDDFTGATSTLKKCSCRCVWCRICHKRFFMPNEAKKMAQFDWERTRHVTLTMQRSGFDAPSEAYLYVTDRKKLSELVKGLKNGVRVKRGNSWVQKYPPVNISKWYWALEWHRDGFPHWHLLIEVEDKGQVGMIGAEMIRHFWKVGWIKETYFRSKAHFKNIVGYYGKHGYFEKHKGYQGLLPEEIKISLRGRRIERTGGSIYHSDLNKEKEEKEKIPSSKAPPEKPEIDYNAILSRCGLYSQVSINMKDIEMTVITDIPYKELKDQMAGEYVDGVGFMATIGHPQIVRILDKALKVTYFRTTNHERYESWSYKFRVKIEKEMLKGAYNRSRNPTSMRIDS
jgi:hypothetical protein